MFKIKKEFNQKKILKNNIKNKEDFVVTLVHLNGTLNMTSAGLHAFIDKAGYKINSVFFRELNFLGGDPPSENEINDLIKLLKELSPNIIGMSVQSMSFWDCVYITQELKKNFACPIMWGGIQPMIDPIRCLNYADIIIRGEAEEALLELFESIRNNKKYNHIKNLWVRGNKENIYKNEYRPLIKNLDSLPFPDYSDKDKFYLIKGIVYRKNPNLHYKYGYNITTSRGCPMRCTFCFEHVLNREFNFKYLRRRSVDNVISELKEAIKLYPKIKSVNFWDNIFTMDKEWVKDFSVKYKQEINKPFFCYGHASLIKDDEMIKALSSAGLKHIFLGMQTGSEKIRRETYKRSETNEDIIRAAKIIHDSAPKAELRFDTIISEFETQESLEDGIKFLLQLPKPFKINKNDMAYYLDFDITKMALEQGLITENNIASVNKDVRTQYITKETVKQNPFINYYFLIGKSYVPNFFLRYCLKNNIETRHHKLFSNFCLTVDGIDVKLQQIRDSGYLITNLEFTYIIKKLFGK